MVARLVHTQQVAGSSPAPATNKNIGGTMNIIEKKKEEQGQPIENYEYLLHHIEIDADGNEVIHHCLVYDHIANMFEQEHLIVVNGKVYYKNKQIKNGVFHVISGLEETQQTCWSDEQAVENKITPKKMVPGMTYKNKSKEW